MEARFSCAAIVAACLLSLGASHRTQNFIVTAQTQELATEIGEQAEVYRRELAIEWLGAELPAWSQLCPIDVKEHPRLGAGGATSFSFHTGFPSDWTMSIQGSRERLLDSVLPHEVTHTIFATHFRRPLPRWADEGACTTVEHESEKARQKEFLIEFLTTRRGIAFNQMFAMKEYPPDVMPLYSQGYSLARYLIAQGGKRKFVDYVGAGMASGNWPATTQKFYGFRDLSDLQVTWLEWVRQGRPELEGPNGDGPAKQPLTQLASSDSAQQADFRFQSPDDATVAPASKLVPVPRDDSQQSSRSAVDVSTYSDIPGDESLPLAAAFPQVATRESSPGEPSEGQLSDGEGQSFYAKARDTALSRRESTVTQEVNRESARTEAYSPGSISSARYDRLERVSRDDRPLESRR